MKAARFYNKGDIRIEDIPEPTVAPGTVGINVAWCGICGTDLHEFMEGPIFIPPCGHPHPISGESAPVTMGHEFSGVVYAVGEGVDDIKVGQHVVVEPYIIRDDVIGLAQARQYTDVGGGGFRHGFQGIAALQYGNDASLTACRCLDDFVRQPGKVGFMQVQTACFVLFMPVKTG